MSAILSPATNPLTIPPDGGPRSSLTYSKRQRPSNSKSLGSSSKRERNATSPHGTAGSGSTTRSTRSSARLSGSPEKKAAELRKNMGIDGSYLSPPAPLSPANIDDNASVMDNITVGGSGSGSQILEEEEGEEEIENDIDGELDDADIDKELDEDEVSSERTKDGLTPLTSPPSVVEAPRFTRIRLNVGGGGTKRKAEDELPDMVERVAPEMSKDDQLKAAPIEEHLMAADSAPPSRMQSEGPMTPPPDIDEEKLQLEAAIQSIEKEPLKRQPRRKRKWLKKGEVDPEDPEAVARQQAKHLMIDEAIASLDEQERLIREGVHPQYTTLLDELDLRLKIQLERCEKRYEAHLGDLQRMRNHDLNVTRSDFLFRRNDLANKMDKETRLAMSRVSQERVSLNRIPTDHPALRDGRGAGGWPFYKGKSLAKGEEPLIPVAIGSKRMRKAIDVDIRSVGYEQGKSDLDKILAPPPKIERSPSPVRNRRNERSANQRTSSQVDRHDPYSRSVDAPIAVAEPPPPLPPQPQPVLPSRSSHSQPSQQPIIPVASYNHHSMRGYALHGKEASYAVPPSQQPPTAQNPPSRQETNGHGRSHPPSSSSSTASQGQAQPAGMYLTWQEYRALATHDYHGRLLPTRAWDRDLMLRDSYNRFEGRVTRDMLRPALAAQDRNHDQLPSRSSNPITATASASSSSVSRPWGGVNAWGERERERSPPSSTHSSRISASFNPPLPYYHPPRAETSPRTATRRLPEPALSETSWHSRSGSGLGRLPSVLGSSGAQDARSGSSTSTADTKDGRGRSSIFSSEMDKEQDRRAKEREEAKAADRFIIPPFRGAGRR